MKLLVYLGFVFVGVCAAIPESALLKLASNDLEANMIESYFECGPLCRAVCGFRFESE